MLSGVRAERMLIRGGWPSPGVWRSGSALSTSLLIPFSLHLAAE